ncbi:helix-turn-helix domain-containing protein [Robbsia andropogonis]|uniref:helix-turn-helix domain-containing protein n=1 Tax=Robbsia andropogonis TaxID=28092 RepID=UPI000464637C|nr:helix-turn-helix transcriptional regulator [Robbsia andropogonis]
MTELGKFVRERRKILGLSQTQLAQRLGVDDAYISAIERGVRTPGELAFIRQLAAALELDAAAVARLEAVAESSKRLVRLSAPLPLYKYEVLSALVSDGALTEADMKTIADVHAAIEKIRRATAAVRAETKGEAM